MNYRQYSDHIKLCLYLGKEPGGEFKEYYDFITGLWRDMEISVVDNYKVQSIILHKGDMFYMEQDFKNDGLRCDWDRIWSFFQFKKGLEVPETKDFIQSMVEEHLKCKVSTPDWLRYILVDRVEEHLKCTALTPATLLPFVVTLVEEHLKCKALTPNGTGMAGMAHGWKNISNARH
jgi:hypothetical protein